MSDSASGTTARTTDSGGDQLDGVLVVGGGYAGLHAVKVLRDADVRVTIVNPDARHDFVTRLAAVAGGTSSVDDASCDLARFCPNVVVGSVTGVRDGEVDLEDGRTLAADAVIVASGSVPTQPPVDGIEHALTLRTADDAVAIRDALDDTDAVVIIGGGPSGVQLAGAIASAHPSMEVHLVDGEDELLSSMDSSLGEGAARILTDRGVSIRLGDHATSIDPDGIEVAGERIDGLPIWSGGFASTAAHLGPDVNEADRILVDDHLRIMGMERTFAVGDVAAHLGTDGQPLPMSAQIAVQAGTQAAQNVLHLFRDEPLEDSKLVQRGWVLDLGGRRGLGQFGPVVLAAPVADLVPPLLHTAIDVKTLIGIGGLSAVTL